jgi:maleylpyruvate isomerase
MDPADLDPLDAAARADELLTRVRLATASALASTADLTDEQAREPSLLPGWSRGHVLTHLARNADGLRNLLVWARTGVETPQYPSAQARDDGIEAGADRPAAALAADIAESAARFSAEAQRLAGADWTARVAGVGGHGHPAWYTMWRRLSEVEIHHVDLDLGYQPQDWPLEFASQCLTGAAGNFTRPDCVPAALVSADDGTEHRIGPPDQPATVTISGPTRELLAWLIGRAPGDRLVTEPAGPLPPVPSW